MKIVELVKIFLIFRLHIEANLEKMGNYSG